MSYAMSGALQQAIFDLLRADPALAEEVGAEIHDAVPPGPPPAIYVLLGDERVRGAGDRSAGGARHEVTVSVITEAPGFAAAKRAAAAISDALEGARPPLARGRVVGLWFRRARAFREAGGARRRIEMRFAARLDDS